MSINYEHFTFSGGEEQVTVKECGNTFVHRIESSQDLIKLALIKEALPQDSLVSIMIPYFPYARQDRVMNPGEAHALRFVCNFLGSLGFYKIFTHDIHSDVAFGILPNLISISRSEVLLGKDLGGEEFEPPWEGARDYHAVISPDGGALKHIYKDAAALGIDKVLFGNKQRDVTTGEITSTNVEARLADIIDRKLLITDDICDGGRTFIELAKFLKEAGAKQVDLYVTHGIFSAGLGPLTQYIDNVYTTDTRTNSTELLDKFKVIMDGNEPQDFLTILPVIGE